jgi:diguanylate cyclase
MSPLIQQVSAMIKANLREGIDTPAVIADDLIGIIVPETTREKVYAFARRLKERIENKGFEVNSLKLTISLGISAYPESANSVNELMESATQALKKAQKIGEGKILLAPLLQVEE